MEITKEQEKIINSKEDFIIVNACAGSGKTFTLFEFAKKNNSKKILYLIYNKAMKDEAEIKFSSLWNVKIMTTHGLAYYFEGKKLKNKIVNNYRVMDIAESLKLNINKKKEFKEACIIFDIFKNYIISSVLDIKEFGKIFFKDKKNLELILEIKPDNQKIEDFKEIILDKLLKVFNMQKEGYVNISHDFYLKLFQIEDKIFLQNMTMYY